MKRSLLTLSLLALSAPAFAGGPELQPLREIAIQDGGRTKPFDSFARELARRVQGARAFGFDTRGRPRAHRVGARDARRARPLEGGADRQGDPRRAAAGGGAPERQGPLQLPGAGRPQGSPGGGGAGPGEARPQRGPRPGRARGARPLRPPDHLPGRHVGRVAPHRAPRRRPEGRLVLARRPRDPADGGDPPGAARPGAGERGGRRLPRGRPAGRADRDLGPRQPPRRARPRCLPRAEGPRPRGPLQPRQAVPHRLAPVPLRLPRAARELPARLAGLLVGRHGPGGRRASSSTPTAWPCAC